MLDADIQTIGRSGGGCRETKDELVFSSQTEVNIVCNNTQPYSIGFRKEPGQVKCAMCTGTSGGNFVPDDGDAFYTTSGVGG